MTEKAIYKCVVFATNREVEEHEDHGTYFFAWKSAILEVHGDTDPNSLPPDGFEQLMTNNPEALEYFENPDLIGLSVWRGTLTIELGENADLFSGVSCFPHFNGKWNNLSIRDWSFLQERALESLVDLNRFTIPCSGMG